MQAYPFIFTFHIIFAGMWLAFLFINLVFVKRIKMQEIQSRNFLSTYLNFTIIFEMIGAIGMLFTGVYMVAVNFGYGFFVMSSNHWLATKQMIFVVVLILIFVSILPNWLKLNSLVKSNVEIKLENIHLRKLMRVNAIINFLVLLNFLFAITHTFYN